MTVKKVLQKGEIRKIKYVWIKSVISFLRDAVFPLIGDPTVYSTLKLECAMLKRGRQLFQSKKKMFIWNSKTLLLFLSK